MIVLKKKQQPKPEQMTSDSADLAFWTIKQVAAHLRICTRTARRIIKRKGIPVARVGRQTRIAAKHVRLFADCS